MKSIYFLRFFYVCLMTMLISCSNDSDTAPDPDPDTEPSTDPETEIVEFTAISGSFNTVDKLLNMTFSDSSGAQMFLSLDISSGLSGTFPVKYKGGPGIITGATANDREGASWYLPAGGEEKCYFTGGQAEVAFAEGDLMTITFSGELVLSDSLSLKATASRLTLVEMEILPMTIGEIMYYGPNDNGTGLFFLYLKDGEQGSMTHNMGLYVNTEPVEDVSKLFIPSGEYVRNTGSTLAFSLNAAEGETHYNCFWWTTQPALEQFMAIDAGMTVSRSGDIYTITGFMLTTPYKGIKFSFSGKLPAEDYS